MNRFAWTFLTPVIEVGDEIQTFPFAGMADKFNRNHDARGRFAPGGGSSSGGGGGGGGSVLLESDITDEELMTEWLRQSEGFSHRDITTLQEYSRYAHKSTNSYLRRNRGLPGKGDPNDESDLRLSIRHMDNTMSLTSVNMTVYRGTPNNRGIQFKVGDSFVDHGFTSTSTLPDIGAHFSAAPPPPGVGGGTRTPVIFKIAVPAGSKALVLNGGSNFPEESEVILNRGSKYTVKRVEIRTGVAGFGKTQIVELSYD